MPKINPGTGLEESEPGTGTRTVLGPWIELETELELEMMRKVLQPLPELVPGQGAELGTMPEMEVETKTEQGNKYSVLHP